MALELEQDERQPTMFKGQLQVPRLPSVQVCLSARGLGAGVGVDSSFAPLPTLPRVGVWVVSKVNKLCHTLEDECDVHAG